MVYEITNCVCGKPIQQCRRIYLELINNDKIVKKYSDDVLVSEREEMSKDDILKQFSHIFRLEMCCMRGVVLYQDPYYGDV